MIGVTLSRKEIASYIYVTNGPRRVNIARGTDREYIPRFNIESIGNLSRNLFLGARCRGERGEDV